MQKYTKHFLIFLCALIISYISCTCVFAQVTVETGVTISATVDSGDSNQNNNTPPPLPSPPSLGGGGGLVSSGAIVNFSGHAYPFSKIVILQNYVPIVTTVAGQDAQFSVSVAGLSGGNYNFAVYGQDDMGRRSDIISFPLVITPNITVDISGIFISPTIALDKTTVAQGDNITIFGRSVPDSHVVISVHSKKEVFASVATDKNGIYLYTLDTSPLELGTHTTKSKAVLGNIVSDYGASLDFNVIDKDAVSDQNNVDDSNELFSRADINRDGKVDIIDYSILAFWYNNSNPPKKVDLNNDGIVNLVDFSILAYYWTGN